MNDSITLGEADSCEDGDALDTTVGLNDGCEEGFFDSPILGNVDLEIGAMDGTRLGLSETRAVGSDDGTLEGLIDG